MKTWLILCIPFLLSALEFNVATYNVENLFDAKSDGGEYQEYLPNNKHGWDEGMVRIKLSNLAKVILDLDADVIALEEVENKEILDRLNRSLGSQAYPYLFFPQKKERVSIETALLSRFPIEKTASTFLRDHARGIHKVTLKIDEKTLDIYLNHWPAYKEKEDERLLYAKTLHLMLTQEEGKEFIVLGDLNSPYREQKGRWGMGLVTFLQAGDKNAPLYNLWYDLPQEKRYSHSYGREKVTLDHIIIPKTLFDNKGIEYKPASMKVFIRPYMLDTNGYPFRWQISDRGRGVHQGFGFSDHLPITATFTTP